MSNGHAIVAQDARYKDGPVAIELVFRRRAAEQCDELAPFHSITSSARVSSVGGTSRPSALAVLRLMTISNFVGRSTGKSAGFAPFRILSTYVAARLCISA